MYWVIGILGTGFAFAPFIFNYADNIVAMWTSIVLGGAVLLVSLIERADENKGKWEYWTIVAVGLFTILAPFIFSFESNAVAMWVCAGIGLLLALLAGSKLYYEQK